MKNVLLYLFIGMILSGCKRNHVDFQLTEPGSVWRFSTPNLTRPGELVTADLIFRTDGYVYEESTVLNFPWNYVDESQILYLKGQKFKVMKAESKRLDLKSEKYGVSSSLIRIK